MTTGAHQAAGQITRIADQLFVVGHDEFTGRCHANVHMLNLGLGAALVAELAVDGFVGVTAGTGVVWARHSDATPSTGATHDLLDFIRSEPKLPLADWMTFLARDDNARHQVAQRLMRVGAVTTRTERHRLRRGRVYPAVHTSAAQYVVARIGAVGPRLVAGGGPVTDADVLLLALLVATDLSGRIAHESAGRLRVPAHLLDGLPEQLRALAAHAHAALGTAALRGR